MHTLSSLPVVVPLLAAPLLVTIGPFAPRLVEDAVGLVAPLAAVTICILLAHTAGTGPYAYWVGGWRPEHGTPLGISLAIDPLGAGLAAFAALLVLAALIYSIRYFDAVAGLFHALMVLFLAGMVAFCLTGDLFDLVVFFELMSVVAYALTAYRIEERAPIQGAINFAITNSIGGYAMFIAVAMLYAQTGQLNMTAIGVALGHGPPHPAVIVAMVLLLLGFLTKAAIVPLHFWLADAHAVAPAPVCVLFSGVMVELGVYAAARIYWVMFAGTMAPRAGAVTAIVVGAGAVTALLATWMSLVQRHVKRLLAFSTIAHVGLFVCGVGLLRARALAGTAVLIVGHGLTKAALFMGAGVLLHRFRTVDEFDLHGRGRAVPAVGAVFAAGGLLLAGPPPLSDFQGKSLLLSSASDAGYGWLTALAAVVSAGTAGAVLRVTGRVFFGWGPSEGPDPSQARAAEERVDETRGEPRHTPPLMLIVPAVLIVGAAIVGVVPGFVPWVGRSCALFTDHAAYAQWAIDGHPVAHWPAFARWPAVPVGHPSAEDLVVGLATLAAALGLAALGLFGRSFVERAPLNLWGRLHSVSNIVRGLHSGHIGDYIAWWTAGAALVGGTCLVALG